MSFTSAGVRVWDSTEAASIHGASQAMGDSLNTKVVQTFATTAARDAAFSGLTSAQKNGIIAHVQSRDGHCYWSARDADWRWISVARVVANQDQGVNSGTSGSVATASATYVPLQVITAQLLPGGNRLVRIDYSVIVTQNVAGSQASPRVSVSGNGMGTVGATNTLIQAYLPGNVGFQTTMARSWQYILSGGIDINVYCNSPTGSASLVFNYGRLDVTDLGPNDG